MSRKRKDCVICGRRTETPFSRFSSGIVCSYRCEQAYLKGSVKKVKRILFLESIFHKDEHDTVAEDVPVI